MTGLGPGSMWTELPAGQARPSAVATISGVQCPEGFLNLGPSLWINGELHEVAVKDMTWGI